MKLLVRQPYTESNYEGQAIVEQALDMLAGMREDPVPLTMLTGYEALSGDSFQKDFTQKTGQAFSPKAFRDWRISLLNEADAIINLRVGLSESTAFEIAYNIFSGRKIPMLFAVWEKAPMKTTLLRELQDLCPVTYVEFKQVEQLRVPFREFLGSFAPARVSNF